MKGLNYASQVAPYGKIKADKQPLGGIWMATLQRAPHMIQCYGLEEGEEASMDTNLLLRSCDKGF